MKRFTIICALLLSITLSFVSCKKHSGADPENPIVGTWTEIDMVYTSRSVTFNKDKTFNVAVSANDGGGTLITGTYTLEGNRLLTKALERREQEPGKKEVKNLTNGEIYENATFSISDDILKIKYTTYPADAPVTTTATFKKK